MEVAEWGKAPCHLCAALHIMVVLEGWEEGNALFLMLLSSCKSVLDRAEGQV